MLDQKTIETIKATVPVLEKHGKEITTHFYKVMFANHPELLNIFNHANQKQERQQQALANFIYEGAKNIDKLEQVLPLVKQVGHKHRSLGVKPEHYPIVGKHLLLAIKDVLGDAATDEILEAWGKAYNVIANAFIDVEQEMYTEAESKRGGWADFRPFTVFKKVQESDVITSFYLRPKDEQRIATYVPGQYISVKCSIPGEGYTHIRQYSLSDKSGNDYYRISVKREKGVVQRPDGVVSNYLHDHVNEGDELLVSAPAGDFVLTNDDVSRHSPIVLISGGVGITPMMSMLHTLSEQQPEREVIFVHAAINGSLHAFHREVQQVVQKHESFRYYVCYESPTEDDRRHGSFDKEAYIDRDWLQSIVPSASAKHAQFYFCGPVPFMKAIYSSLITMGVQDNHIHYEFFGPALTLKAEQTSIQSS